MNRKKKIKIFLGIVFTPILFFGAFIGAVYIKQDQIVKELVTTLNEDFKGRIELDDSHVSPFVNFPYVSIDLDHVRIFEGKEAAHQSLLDVKHIYIGFDLWKIIGGTFDIKKIRLSDGFVKLVQHKDGTFNIANALSQQKEIADAGEEFHMHIKTVQLKDIDLLKINEANNLTIEAFIDDAKAAFRTSPNHVMVKVASRFMLNVIQGRDTTFIRHKHLQVATQLDFLEDEQKLVIQPSSFRLEKALFNMDGTIDIDNDMYLDINFHGNKPNFDLFLAFAPEELAPVLERYDNQGKIFFEASAKGKSINGHNPIVVADFGCEDAFFNNKISQARVDELFFKGHFTTGASGDASTAEFSLTDFSAKPEAGAFRGSLNVRNFKSPEIDMKLRSEFDLDFLARFMNITDLQDLKGQVALTMNFHDIVDLQNPERSVERLNESYFTELEVRDLAFRSPLFHLPVQDIDIKATMDGHQAEIQKFNIKVGDSDISLTASISDLPAILHHTAIPVTANLQIKSGLLDIRQLTSGDTITRKPINEQIRDLSLKLKFNSSARAFTESPNLPAGEFFIEDLYAQLTHYPHKLHDFHADVYVDDHDFRVIDFTGMIDKSDFHFNGRLRNYELWFSDEPRGDTKIEFNLASKLLQLEDLFAYGGENYVPEDYRHEQFSDLKIHGFADLHFNKGLKSSDVYIDKWEAGMKIHPLRFEDFKGRFHYEDKHLVVENFGGKLGKSRFSADLNYYLGKDATIRKRDNMFSITAPHLDFDELFDYTPPTTAMSPEDHEKGFNIYDLPFTDMVFKFDIKHLNYHRYLINDFYAKARTQTNHYIYVDTLSLVAAGGNIHLKGYFNGSDRNRIYFNPTMHLEHVDLDKLLLKFENFGQDHLVSENLHGELSGKLTGKIHVHADLVPIIDDSDIQIDFEVVKGRLEHYAALDALSDYFKDRNLNRIFFDTLKNNISFSNGVLFIPSMTINSSLGFIEISGRQDTGLNMEYLVRVPWKLVTQAASQKLFGKRPDEVVPEDEIHYRDETKRVRFINLKLSGTPENYKISLGKKRS